MKKTSVFLLIGCLFLLVGLYLLQPVEGFQSTSTTSTEGSASNCKPYSYEGKIIYHCRSQADKKALEEKMKIDPQTKKDVSGATITASLCKPSVLNGSTFWFCPYTKNNPTNEADLFVKAKLYGFKEQVCLTYDDPGLIPNQRFYCKDLSSNDLYDDYTGTLMNDVALSCSLLKRAVGGVTSTVDELVALRNTTGLVDLTGIIAGVERLQSNTILTNATLLQTVSDFDALSSTYKCGTPQATNTVLCGVFKNARDTIQTNYLDVNSVYTKISSPIDELKRIRDDLTILLKQLSC
jgi:hypothetical protein